MIGMTKPIMANHPHRIQQDPFQERIMSSAAARGTTMRTTLLTPCARRLAPPRSCRRSSLAMSASAVLPHLDSIS